MTLIDRWMPEFGANEVHHIDVGATPERTFNAILHTDLAGNGIVRALLAMRAIPSALSRGTTLRDARVRAAKPITVQSFEQSGFRVLEQDPPREIVIGLEGRFWTPSGGVCTQDPAQYMMPIPADVVRAIWNFSVAEASDGCSRLTTETRIAWSDSAAGRSFMRYWFFMRPWSGLIRRLMLRSIAAEARKQLA